MSSHIDILAKQLSADLQEFSKDPKNLVDGYSYEKEYSKIMKSYEAKLLSATVGRPSENRNFKKPVLTSYGPVSVNKTHPLSQTPQGFKISGLLQSHMCRIGSKLPFREASEELYAFLELPKPVTNK
ncbi:MAG: hypothetical protein GY816_02560 [Cytophagales bacterium]|nr:hypothetical protein [Cytophagales bacterium]